MADSRNTQAPFGRRHPKRPVKAHRPPGGRRSLLRKPIVWLVALVLAAVGAYFKDTVRAVIGNWASPERIADSVSGAPIRVIDVRRDTETQNYSLLPMKETAEVRRVLTDPAYPRWPGTWHVIDVGESQWEITVATQRRSDVDIVDMTPVIEGGRCGRPPSGILVENPTAGANGKIPLLVVPDSPRPVFQWHDEKDRLRPFFTGDDPQRITLEKGKPETIDVLASMGRVGTEDYSDSRYCKWNIKVTYIADGAHREMTISAPGGRPFELTGLLKDLSRYPAVYLSSLGCSYIGQKRVTGAEYAKMTRDVIRPGGHCL